MSKAYGKAFPDSSKTNISRVAAEGLQIYGAANELGVGSLSNAEVHSGVLNFSGSSPDADVTISQVDQSIDSLPIVSGKSMISLHFTLPRSEVISSGDQQIFDIETLEEEDLTYDLNMNVAQFSKITISFDIQKVGEMEAAHFMQMVKFYLDDPDMMLL